MKATSLTLAPFVLAAGVAALGCLASPGAARAGETPERRPSGIEGDAVIGPLRPRVRVGETAPNEGPYETTLVILKASDRSEAARVTTGSDGRFKVALPPGDYVVAPAPQGERPIARAEEQPVKVRRGRFARVTIHFDSGMR